MAGHKKKELIDTTPKRLTCEGRFIIFCIEIYKAVEIYRGRKLSICVPLLAYGNSAVLLLPWLGKGYFRFLWSL